MSDLILTSEYEHVLEAVKKRREEIMSQQTPLEYVKSKPIGGRDMAYVPAPFMDNKFKQEFPVYENSFAFAPFVFQNWIIVGVQLKDKTTGNIELGLKAHRIQFKADKKRAVEDGKMFLSDLTPFDMIDVGNDVSACLTEAIKNAQSRFGICADIYKKQIISSEELKTLETDFEEFLKGIENPLSKQKYSSNWKSCKTPQEKLVYLQELTNN